MSRWAAPRIALIGPDPFEARKRRRKCPHYLLGAHAVVDGGRMNHHLAQQSLRIHEQMALVSIGLLATVATVWATLLGRFGGLAVDDASTRLVVSPDLPPNRFAQRRVDLLPCTISPPDAKIIVDGFAGWPFLGQERAD